MELKKKKRVIWSSDRREKSSSACARISTFEMVKYIVRPNLSSLLFLRIIRKKKRSNYGIAAVARGMFYGLSVVAARSLVGQARGISRSLKKAEEEGTLIFCPQKKRQTNTH